ncbi:MAG: Do family serine endopeptidase [Pseudomonadota bacterium]|nr:Do family serine endopeptidase [Pseudomonadota bacterium]
MKKMLKPLLLVPLTAIATTAVVMYPAADAQQREATVQTMPAAAAPELVTGLPDFTRLVEQVGSGVVSVEARIAARQSGGFSGADPLAEIFRRFGMPIPGGPGQRSPMPEMPRGTSLGTGFLISADGYVLTNHHVVEGADEISVRLADKREMKAKLVGSDAQSDVALLKVEGHGLPALRLGGSGAVKPGQWVVAIGSPYGLDHSVTAGIVSAVGRSTGGQQYVPFIQTDVAINRGNSGGPLLNTRGEVVGINSQIFSVSGGFQGISFAIPIDTAMNAVEQLKKTGQVRRGLLGVNMQSLSSDLARGMGLPDSRGALVSNVEAGGAADKAGIQPGDVIRSFNGTAINQTSDLPPLVGALPPGSKVRLGVWREGRERSIEAVLGEAATGNASRFAGRADNTAEGAHNMRGLLGLRIAELDANDRRQLNLKAGEGVGIVAVESRAAREAGINPGDVILAVGRQNVGSAMQLQTALASVKPGDTVTLRLAGRGGTRFVAVKTEASSR